MHRKGMTSMLFGGGVTLTALFYGILYSQVRQGALYDFFCNRGWYQHGSMTFFFFGLLLVAARWWVFRKEVHAVDMPLPTKKIAPEEAGVLAERIPAKYRGSLLGRRLADLFRSYARQEEIGPLVDRLAANDREELERSASMLGWVRSLPPVLGLLGTLDGLRGGIAEISHISNVQEIEEIRKRLQQFASHSSTAFDTTLLGITCALVLSAAIFFLRKLEDTHLNKVDEIARDMARRLHRTTGMEEGFREAAQELMAGIFQNLDRSFSAVTAQILEAFRHEMHEGISGTVRGWLASWREELSRTSGEILSQLRSSGPGVPAADTSVLVAKLEAIERALVRPKPLQIMISADQRSEKESHEIARD